MSRADELKPAGLDLRNCCVVSQSQATYLINVLERERDEARAKVIELATDLARLRTATAPLVLAEAMRERDEARQELAEIFALTVDQAERILLALKDARDVNRQLWKEFPDNTSCPIAHQDLHDSLAEITDHDLAAIGDAEAAARLIVHPGEPLPETKVRKG